MELNKRLYDIFLSQAQKVNVTILSLGLGYTAVTTSDGGIGLSYTYFNDKKSCMVLNQHIDYEGRPAEQLLEKIMDNTPIERSMALALINALNYRAAIELPEDADNAIMFEKFRIDKGRQVAMVGYFGPLVRNFEKQGISLEILDISRGLGKKEDFYKKLANWANVLLLTSTSILNNSTEEILANVGEKVNTVMLGPSTPLVADAFSHLPVHMLAGTVPIEQEKTLKAIRHGMGTPVLHRYSRKVFLTLPG
ncbi:MAG: DUF364 domain-containing protein [Desulfobacterales bacterium]|nr:MAG: DUF364 domain-containing protein [Desulfobacterales bacterium]